MAKKEAKEDAPVGAPAWMMTYGDMMSLLLTFFVLIVSFSTIQDVGFKKAIGSLKGALGILGQQQYIVSLGKIMIPEATPSFVSRHTKQTTGEVSKELNFVSSYEGTEVFQDNRGLNIVLPAELLFHAGDDIVNNEAYPLLKKLGAFLYEQKNSIMVEGHTDSSPISTLRFPSNWHLSSSRAISIARYLQDACAITPKRFSVMGCAAYRPVAPNDTEENRRKNRRVVIIVESDEWSTYKKEEAA